MVARATLANNAITTLALAITSSSDTTLNATSSAAFPALAGGNYFYATLLDSSNIPEVVKVTGIAGTIFTIERGQDNTAARTFAVGAKLSMNLNAAVLAELLGKDLLGATGVLGMANGGTGQATAPLAVVSLGLQTTGNKDAVIPSRVTANRTAAPSVGNLGYNSETGQFEGYGAAGWGQIGGGTVADGTLVEHKTSILNDYTLTAGTNGLAVKKLSVATGKKLTVPTGQSVVVVGVGGGASDTQLLVNTFSAQTIAGAKNFTSPITMGAAPVPTPSGAAPVYGARAWVNFVGATGAITASGNVASVTRNGVGDYTINFTTALPNTDYAATAFCTSASAISSAANAVLGETKTTAAYRIRVTRPYNDSAYDASAVHVAIFG